MTLLISVEDLDEVNRIRSFSNRLSMVAHACEINFGWLHDL